MTIGNPEPEAKQVLHLRAGRNERSIEQEVRSILRQEVVETPVANVGEQTRRRPTGEKIERDVPYIVSLGRRLREPFDLKRFSDDLSDGIDWSPSTLPQ